MNCIWESEYDLGNCTTHLHKKPYLHVSIAIFHEFIITQIQPILISSQEEIYRLMKTDIYPRFLKADYETLLKSANSNGSIGKG